MTVPSIIAGRATLWCILGVLRKVEKMDLMNLGAGATPAMPAVTKIGKKLGQGASAGGCPPLIIGSLMVVISVTTHPLSTIPYLDVER
jgi:hypothetical protein